MLLHHTSFNRGVTQGYLFHFPSSYFRLFPIFTKYLLTEPENKIRASTLDAINEYVQVCFIAFVDYRAYMLVTFRVWVDFVIFELALIFHYKSACNIYKENRVHRIHPPVFIWLSIELNNIQIGRHTKTSEKTLICLYRK